MDIERLIQLVKEIPTDTTLEYVRGTDSGTFLNVSDSEARINAVTPKGEGQSWAPSYLNELASKIQENVPFNLSGILNNKGTYRPVLETIIAHTREFYKVKKDSATLLVWVPSKPKASLQIEEIGMDDIPPIKGQNSSNLSKDELSKKLKDGFRHYFSNYLRLSTGKCEDRKLDNYFQLYERFLETPLKQKFDNFNSIFEIDNSSDLNDLFKNAKSEIPDVSVLLLDKWPREKEQQTLYYEVWTMVRHYKVFLDLLHELSYISCTPSKSLKASKPIELNDTNRTWLQYITAIRTKPFVLLAGISGTGKSRIVRELAKACWSIDSKQRQAQKPSNYEIIQVKPNWHDSSELFGYVSRITGKPKYIPGKFIKFIAKAWENENVPHFLCLDEMNLAPVEQYFAEYLSVIETRKLNVDKIITDPLLSADDDSKDDPQGWYHTLVSDITTDENVREKFLKDGITIPQNLVVMGTVNMDETTFTFSRKVLDRAMTIEMNEVDLRGGLKKSEEENIILETTQVIGDAAEGSDIYDDNSTECDIVLNYLEDINSKLENTPFKIAYRARNEFLLYAINRLKLSDNEDTQSVLKAAMDEMTSMKILSRIEGDEQKVTKNLFTELSEVIKKHITGEDESAQGKSVSLIKIKEMKKKLENTGFTSFWS